MSSDAQRPYHHGNLPAALLDAVAEQVDEAGVAGVTLRETARRAGVSHAAPAHHFGDKQGLLTAFARQGHQQLAEHIDRAVHAADPSTGERLAAIAVTYAVFGVGHAAHFAVMFRPDIIDVGDPDLQAAGQPNFDRLLTAVNDHQQTGWQPGRDPLELTVMIWSCVHGLVELWQAGLVDEQLKRDGIAPFARSLLEVCTRVFTTPRTTTVARGLT